jgi:hypothetical protein
VGTGYAEMPQDGRRYRFKIEKYRDDDGQEWGQITSMEEIPDVGPYIWIPSYGTEAAEADYMFGEWQEEQRAGSPETSYLEAHRDVQSKRMNTYNELRDERAVRTTKTKLLGGRR